MYISVFLRTLTHGMIGTLRRDPEPSPDHLEIQDNGK